MSPPAITVSVKPGRIVLKSSEFRRAREASWRKLEAIVEIAEKRGLGALGLDDLEEMPLLYRSTLSSLSVARAIALDRHLLLYLENLALRAYLLVYSPKTSLLEAGEHFIHAFPAAVRKARWHLLIVFIAFMVGTAVGFWLTID